MTGSEVRAEKLNADSPSPNGPALKPMSVFLTETPAHFDWVVDGLLIEGGTSLMVGRPKCGKSTLTRQLARCISRGDRCIGRETKRGPVLLFALEDHPDRLRSQLRALGITVDDSICVHAAAAPMKSLDWLSDQIHYHGPKLVIVDPLLKLIRVSDANDYVEMSKKLEPLNTIARETGTHILATHDQNKNERSDFDSVLGSTAITGAVDTVMLLERNGATRTLKTRQRYGDDLEALTLEFDSLTGSIHAGARVAELRLEKSVQFIKDLLGTGGTMTEEEIRKRLGGDSGEVGKALRYGTANGAFTRNGSGKKGNPFFYSMPASGLSLVS